MNPSHSLRAALRRPGALDERVAFALLVAVIGAGMGVVAVGFRELLRGATELFFGRFHGLDLTANLLDRPYVALVPAAGGLLVGLYFRYVVRRPPGHGVSEIMVALETRGSRLRWITSVHTAIASSITIGSGGSAGPEGPIIQIGAALASGAGQLFRISAERLRLLVACGGAAGLSGMYHAPLTGAAFAAEVLLEELDPRSFSLLALAAVSSSAVAKQFHVDSPPSVPALPPPPWQDVPLDVLLGLLAAPLGVLLIVLVHGTGRRVAALRLQPWLKPAIGGLIVGCIGLLLPRILGSSESGIEEALNNRLDIWLLLVLPFAKIAATSITLGSGATGGVFTPSLFIGAVFGGAFGVVARHLWGGASPMSTYALVGMGTVVAAMVNAPLTAVMLVCEFTGDFNLLPEVVAAVAASVILARQLQPDSIYTLPLRHLGIDRALIRRSPLARVTVREVLTPDWPILQPGDTLAQALARARETGRTAFPVVGPAGRYAGMLNLDVTTLTVANGASGNGSGPEQRRVAELAVRDVPTVDAEDSLHDVALLVGSADFFHTLIPVVGRQDGRYQGVVERAVILRTYSAADRLLRRRSRATAGTAESHGG